jgi:type I restriction enzyme R subunit
MFHFAGERYDLVAYAVMPSHVHWLFQPLPEWESTLPDDGRTGRQRIMYSLKRYTANRCNRLLGSCGSFWQAESYDHWVRDVDEMERIIHYIEYNPVKARLTARPQDWVFSSARRRVQIGAEFGMPLSKPDPAQAGQDRNPNLRGVPGP